MEHTYISMEKLDVKKYIQDTFKILSKNGKIETYIIFNKLVEINTLLNYNVSNLTIESLQNIIRKRKETTLDLYLILYDYFKNHDNFLKYQKKITTK